MADKPSTKTATATDTSVSATTSAEDYAAVEKLNRTRL